MIQQLSVFVENKPQAAASVLAALADANINVRALSLADTTDFGILRLIVDRPEDALAIVKKSGHIARLSPVLAVAMEHKPGSLAQVLHALGEAGAQIEYMYASTSSNPSYAALAIVAIAGLPGTMELAKRSGVKLISEI